MAKKITLIFKTADGEERILLPLIEWLWDTGKGTRIRYWGEGGLRTIDSIEPFNRVRARIDHAKDIQNGKVNA